MLETGADECNTYVLTFRTFLLNLVKMPYNRTISVDIVTRSRSRLSIPDTGTNMIASANLPTSTKIYTNTSMGF